MLPPADAPGFLRRAQKSICAGYNEYSVLIIPCLPLYFKENLGKIHETFNFFLKKEYILAIKSEDVSIYKHIRICSTKKTAAQAPAATVRSPLPRNARATAAAAPAAALMGLRVA